MKRVFDFKTYLKTYDNKEDLLYRLEVFNRKKEKSWMYEIQGLEYHDVYHIDLEWRVPEEQYRHYTVDEMYKLFEERLNELKQERLKKLVHTPKSIAGFEVLDVVKKIQWNSPTVYQTRTRHKKGSEQLQEYQVAILKYGETYDIVREFYENDKLVGYSVRLATGGYHAVTPDILNLVYEEPGA